MFCLVTWLFVSKSNSYTEPTGSELKFWATSRSSTMNYTFFSLKFAVCCLMLALQSQQCFFFPCFLIVSHSCEMSWSHNYRTLQRSVPAVNHQLSSKPTRRPAWFNRLSIRSHNPNCRECEWNIHWEQQWLTEFRCSYWRRYTGSLSSDANDRKHCNEKKHPPAASHLKRCRASSSWNVKTSSHDITSAFINYY